MEKKGKASPSTTSAAWSSRLAQSPFFFSAAAAALSSRMSRHTVWFRHMVDLHSAIRCRDWQPFHGMCQGASWVYADTSLLADILHFLGGPAAEERCKLRHSPTERWRHCHSHWGVQAAFPGTSVTLKQSGCSTHKHPTGILRGSLVFHLAWGKVSELGCLRGLGCRLPPVMVCSGPLCLDRQSLPVL